MGTDETVGSVERGNWHGVELKSTALRSCKDSLDLIDRAVKLLVSKFRLYTNESCGLHVHVGNENRGFDMRTLKNFCSLITTFDSQLKLLHHPSRVGNPFATSYSNGTTLAEKQSFIEKLETLKGLCSRFHLTNAYGGITKHMAYNFLNLQYNLQCKEQSAVEPLRTIEVHQHRGTLDPELITHWITVVCSLVEKSHRDEGGFRKFFDRLQIKDSMCTVVNLFEDLQLRK